MGDAMNRGDFFALGDLLSAIRTGPFGSALHASDYVVGGVPIINPQHYRTFRIAPDDEVTVSPSLAEGLQTFRLTRGDVIVARRGEMGRCAVITAREDGWLLGTGSLALTPKKSLDPSYLAYFITSPGCVQELSRASVGSTMANLNQKILRSLVLFVPPIDEQRRIIAIVEAHFSRLDAAEQGLKRVQAKLKHARASVLKAAVEGRLVPTEAALARAEGRLYEPASALLARVLAERRARWAERGERGKYKEPVAPETEGLPELPEGWVWASCDQAGDILLGRQRAPQYLKGISPRPYLRVANIRDNWIDWRDVEEMDFSDEHFAKYRLESGDILLCEGQSPELVGQSAIFRGERPNVCFQKTLHRFRPLIGGPTPEFAQIVFRAWVMNRVFMRRASITTNIAHLTLEKLRAAPFSLPPLAEQARIVAEVDRRLSVLDQVEALVGRSLTRCASLRQSILKRAFEGRLVPPSAEVTPE